jgi:hypothetical protein
MGFVKSQVAALVPGFKLFRLLKNVQAFSGDWSSMGLCILNIFFNGTSYKENLIVGSSEKVNLDIILLL